MDDLIPFRFDVPLRKSRQTERHHGADLWTVEGLAATEDVDQQDERLLFKGMDFQPYIKSGVINWNHQDSPDAILGEPIEARIVERSGKPSQFFTKGFLYTHQPKAVALWNHISALEKSQQPITRGIGWSVQGGVLERSGKDLVKSVVRHMALTHEPVNPYTFAKCVGSLAKSLAGVGIGSGEMPPPGVPQGDLSVFTPQNLDATFTSLLLKPCKNGCLDEETGQFKKGFHGMLDHMVLCKSVPVPEAKEFVTLLIHNRKRS